MLFGGWLIALFYWWYFLPDDILTIYLDDINKSNCTLVDVVRGWDFILNILEVNRYPENSSSPRLNIERITCFVQHFSILLAFDQHFSDRFRFRISYHKLCSPLAINADGHYVLREPEYDY